MAPIGPILGQISGLILGVFCDLKIGALGKVTLSSRLLAEKLSAIMKHWLDSPFWAASGGAPVWPQMGSDFGPQNGAHWAASGPDFGANFGSVLRPKIGVAN